MQFYLKFKTKSINIIDVDRRYIGIKDIDEIRKETDVPSLSIDVIDASISRFTRNFFTISISENIARTCGYFEDTNEITILCPSNWANKFVTEKIMVDKSESTGEITNVYKIYTIDEEAIIYNWINNNYPSSFLSDEL